ncbi:hypothetical protein H9P43_008643 [Blastocladiella emersonii ATCC 22665]|nr:hypothetical protein H9P43_008643 [Blastocladiella emersonii ATCC 22665]
MATGSRRPGAPSSIDLRQPAIPAYSVDVVAAGTPMADVPLQRVPGAGTPRTPPAAHRLTVFTDTGSVRSLPMGDAPMYSPAPTAVGSQLARSPSSSSSTLHGGSGGHEKLKPRARNPSLAASSHLSHTVANSADPPEKPHGPTAADRTRQCLALAGLAYLRAAAVLAMVIGVALVVRSVYRGPEFASRQPDAAFAWSTDVRKRGLGVLFNSSVALTATSVLLDLHAAVAPPAGLSPRERLRLAVANGYSAVAITSPNSVDGALAAAALTRDDPEFSTGDRRIVVIPGVEFASCRVRLSLLGVNETIAAPAVGDPTDDEIRAAIARAHSLGGIAIANYGTWAANDDATQQRAPTRDQLVEWGVDGFTVASGPALDLATAQWARGKRANLLLTASNGADSAAIGGPAHAWTVINVADGAPVTANSILAALRDPARAAFLHDARGTQYTPPVRARNPVYTAWRPLAGIAEYLSTAYHTAPSTGSRTPDPWFEQHCAAAQSEAGPLRVDLVAWTVLWLAGFVTVWFALRMAGRRAATLVGYYRYAGRGWQRKVELLVV